MSTLSLSITESPFELLAGIPATILVQANLPCNIFYTLDGTDPDHNSMIVIGPVSMPTNKSFVTFKAFATNGAITSPIISQTYGYSYGENNLRRPHDTVIELESNAGKASYPFGSPMVSSVCDVQFSQTGGTIVSQQGSPAIPDGYDGTATGTPAGFVSTPTDQFSFRYSQTDSIGQIGKGVGTMPGVVLSISPSIDNKIQEQSSTSDRIFNPKAMVIFQDGTNPNQPDFPIINRPHFDLEDATKARDGALLKATEQLCTSGTFVKQVFNPRDNTITCYYYDNRVGRWIISKSPYVSKNENNKNLANVVFGSGGAGGRFVFKWVPFMYHKLTT
jgi:hypothetical protein